MLLTSPPSNVWWFIYSHCYNKFKGQRFICKLGFSPLASIYIYWNFRAKRTIMLCSLSCYDPFFAASRVLHLSKPSGTFCVVFCRLMFSFVIVVIVFGGWLKCDLVIHVLETTGLEKNCMVWVTVWKFTRAFATLGLPMTPTPLHPST